MDTTELVTLWSANVLLSTTIWAVVIVGALYLARKPAQATLRALALTLILQARKFARATRQTSIELKRRTHAALLQLARESVEQSLSRQIHRLGEALSRDLASFPHLHRQVHEQITRIDEDYRNTVEAPPTPPEWLDAISTVAHLPVRDDPAVARMLEDMHATLDRACHESMLAYRAAGRHRHRVLKRMQPLWRRMDRSLTTVQRTMGRLNSRTERLDQRIRQYADVLSARDSVVRRLAASLSIRAVLSCLVLAGIAAAAIVDFHLIARPLAEVGAGGDRVVGFAFNDVISVVVLILMALSGGLLLDTLRVTHLFPEMNWIDETLRRTMAATAGVLVVILLIATAALGWTRDYLIALDLAATSLPTDVAANFPSPVFHWIPALTQSVLTLGLGMAVAATALPLENLLRQGRVLALAILALCLRGTAFLADHLALLVSGLWRFLAAFYDLIIFLPLAAETALQQGLKARQTTKPPTKPESPGSRGL